MNTEYDCFQKAKNTAIEHLGKIKRHEYRIMLNLAVYVGLAVLCVVLTTQIWLKLLHQGNSQMLFLGVGLSAFIYWLCYSAYGVWRSLRRNRQIRAFYRRKIIELNKRLQQAA
ncbi:MAG: hypothetical protein IJ881_01415 [Neisseriaceae bacterium]|nr:hypothetical protein [Neisseriaceae bacterium]MBR3425926.1 hypothetical protein [Neisseriaceae bacterium]